MRGEVWLVRLDPTFGSEMKKTRPCVVISPNEMVLRTVIIAPLTSRGFQAPSRVATSFGNVPGFIALDQIRTVDKARLIRNMGTLPIDELKTTLETLSEMFAL